MTSFDNDRFRRELEDAVHKHGLDNDPWRTSIGTVDYALEAMTMPRSLWSLWEYVPLDAVLRAYGASEATAVAAQAFDEREHGDPEMSHMENLDIFDLDVEHYNRFGTL